MRQFIRRPNMSIVTTRASYSIGHSVGQATQNAQLPRRRVVRGTTRSPRAAEWRAARVETVVTGTHKA